MVKPFGKSKRNIYFVKCFFKESFLGTQNELVVNEKLVLISLRT